MSTSINNLRRLAERDVKDHTALFDLYVTVGRDIDYLSIKFGIDPEDLINLLEGYGEKLRVTAEDIKNNPELAGAVVKDKATAKALEEFGVVLDYSGKGRYKNLSRLLIEEYIEKFYPGIASENPQNDWICLETYLDRFHEGWKERIGTGAKGEDVQEEDSSEPGKKRKARNRFKLF